MSCIKIWQLSCSYFMGYFPLMVLVAILCPHHNISASETVYLIY